MRKAFFPLALIVLITFSCCKKQEEATAVDYEKLDLVNPEEELYASLLDTEFWEDSIEDDSTYALLFAFFDQHTKNVEMAETMSAYLYSYFQNDSSFLKIKEKIGTLPKENESRIKSAMLELLITYHEGQVLGNDMDCSIPENVEMYKTRYFKQFPQSHILFPEDIELFEYLKE